MADASKPDTSFNLSRWAIEHPSVTRFLLGIIVLAGVCIAAVTYIHKKTYKHPTDVSWQSGASGEVK